MHDPHSLTQAAHKSILSKVFTNIRAPATVALLGLLLLLIGYIVGNGVVIASGSILLILGAGSFFILMRVRIWRLP